MKKLLQIVAGQRCSPLLRARGRRYFAASTEEYAKRNYASNVSEYTTVVSSLTAQRRHFLLRDAYDDMMLDGVQPSRDIFHSLIVGTMKGARLQDSFFFIDQMKTMGLVPDVALYNFLVSTCGKCKNSDQAIHILEEMKKNEVKPTGQTYICLLNACAASGRTDRVYAIVRDMTAAGLGLNKFCYAGLIAAHKNKIPLTDDTASKIIELVEQSKGWSSIEATRDMAENVMMGVSEEELYNIPTAEYVHRRAGFLNRQLTVYHVALHAFADLRNVEAMETLLEMLKRRVKLLMFFLIMQTMRCYLHSGNIDRGLQIFEEYMNSGKPAMVELYVTLVEGAMVGYTPKGMELAQDTLLINDFPGLMQVKMNARGFFLSPRMGSELLLVASGEKTGGYTTANYIWDLMQARKITPSFPAVEAYYNGLREREIPEDDARLLLVSRAYDNQRLRFGTGPGRP
ncbi:Pentatricopeptide repeat-containing protein, mitochondrial [Vitis vinifera]|uniref:Pentatricopeptide repeat-containing protein, mitochondrial n=1 Tax=Vitis vinifera TaxID=29760 RepID=A0A438H2J6_VITVI|nr:Pentatricopeptide repeat-containing protein, mitochondrial [Vitis vinifera]